MKSPLEEVYQPDLLLEKSSEYKISPARGFQRIGAWGWVVSVGRVLNGPEEMGGRNVSIYLTSANPEEYPPGFIDANIIEGDRVEVYGLLETIEPGVYDILLVGSKEYYIKPASS
jgi:hypothetical protein